MDQHLNPLAQLIADHRARTGHSYSDIGRRAGLSRSVVHTLATQPISSTPKPETLAKLAAGLELDLAVVTRAAQRAAGYEVYEERTPDSDTKILIGHFEKLTPAERARVAALVEELIRQHSKEDL